MSFEDVHPAAGEDQGRHEPRYVDFPIAPDDAKWENGEPVLNKYSTFLTREHDYPGAKAMLYAAGVPNEEVLQRSPQVGIASVWWEGNPCNMHLLDLGKTVKKAVQERGFIAWQYSTLGVSDGIAQGNEGMRFSLQSRELIADNIETITCAQAHDATIAIPGCDKNMPGCVMAVARHNRPSVIVYGGTVQGGYCEVLKKPIDIVTCYEAQGAYLFGTLGSWTDDKSVTPEEILSSVEKGAVPGPGACGGMYTANSLATIIETLGLSVPGSSSTPAASPTKMREAEKVAEAIEVCMRRNIRRRTILTKESFENALVITMALGGSTNSVLHTLAMARAAEVPLELEDFQRVSRKTPFIANLKPSGKYVIEDLFHIGGVPSVTKLLIAGGLINGDTLTVTGKTLRENVESWPSLPPQQDIIRPLSNPVKAAGHLIVLRGNLAPGGAVAKITGKEGLRFQGEARVFNKESELVKELNAGNIPRDRNIVLVVRYEGPKGGPGMPEQLRASATLIGANLKNVALITDGRYSGASHGFIVGHIVPEAAVGGPIAVVNDGDIITIDAETSTITMNVTDDDITSRLSTWKAPRPTVTRGTLAKYAHLVGSASDGAVTDLF
ncbi:Dihydroxy-acid dehydratase [Colletotrichum sidae]|uniref:dihydroxy-acid dehydratase n=1 Tax=Colletotrichum sidae TaxID=1347389 RepID=A0A4R8T9Y6_9PEZI|nr:Dihydroxy-acid dehydratase [Colletotrichum sidae]